MAEKLNPTKVVTGRVRLSYANIFEPKSIQGSEPKYSLSILIPKSDKTTINKINLAIDAAKKEGLPKWGGKLPPNLKSPLRDGDEERPDEEAYKGCYFINANSKQKPGVVDRDTNPIMDSTEVYSGCYGRVSINFFAFSHPVNKGIGCGLQNIQKLADGESLGGRARAEDDFGGEYEYEGDDDFLG